MANLGEDTRRLRSIKKKRFPWYVLESLLFENGYQAVVLYRIASFFKRNGIPLLGPLFARLSLFLTGVDIAPGAEIGPGFAVGLGDHKPHGLQRDQIDHLESSVVEGVPRGGRSDPGEDLQVHRG